MMGTVPVGEKNMSARGKRRFYDIDCGWREFEPLERNKKSRTAKLKTLSVFIASILFVVALSESLSQHGVYINRCLFRGCVYFQRLCIG